MSPVCPSDNETVTFTCEDSQVNSVQWMALPYILETDPIVLIQSNENEIIRYNFKAILTNVTNTNDAHQVADLTSTLTVLISGISTETVIMCWTTRGAGEGFKKSSIDLTIAGNINTGLRSSAIIISVLPFHCIPYNLNDIGAT